MTAAIIPVPLGAGEVLTTDVEGAPFVVFRPAVEAIGLQYSAQVAKLRTRSWANRVDIDTVAADGKTRSMVAVDVPTFLMWLATVNEAKVSDEARPILVAYQRESAGAIHGYWTNGAAINPRITEPQIEQVQETLDEISRRRIAERMDYKQILNYLKQGGAVDDEYAQVQNTLYSLLFGMTAATIRVTQRQRTGIAKTRGAGFRKSNVAKDYLSEDQLALLNATVLATVAQISLHFPNGASAGQMLEAIGRAVGILAPAQMRVAS